MEVVTEINETREEEILRKHKKERKELQGKIQSLKKSSNKFDKKKKKEVLEEIARLESDLDSKQEEELSSLRAASTELNTLPDEFQNVHINGQKAEEDKEVESDSKVENNQQRISKAQRRRDKRKSELKERDQRIALEEAEEARNGVRAIEGRAISDILNNRNLLLYQIPSDGNCLYGAVDHQLSLVGKSVGVTNLRKLTADHLRKNQNDFLPFITPLADSGEPLSDEQYSVYCDRVENCQEAWGGQVELQALSHVLHQPIEVLQGTGPAVILGAEYKESCKSDGVPQTITLTYHRHAFGLGEHYNSVQPRTDEPRENEYPPKQSLKND